MSEQPNQGAQPTQTPKELRQHMLDQLSAGKQLIEELSNEELDLVAGATAVSEIKMWQDPAHATAQTQLSASAQGKSTFKTFWNSQVAKSGGAVLSASTASTVIGNLK